MKNNIACYFCGGKTKKNGFQKTTKKQMYRCLSATCKKSLQSEYNYLAKTPEVWKLFQKFRRINAPIRTVAHFLEINEKTVSKWILRANKIIPKYQFSPDGIYDMDEIHTYVGSSKNRCCVAYAWNRSEEKPLGLHVGGWSTEELLQVGKKVISFNPKKVYTDGLKQYKIIFKDVLHKTGRNITNHIERQNLNLRKDISFLSRKTICFARTKAMLKARLMWYFWGSQNPLFFLNS